MIIHQADISLRTTIQPVGQGINKVLRICPQRTMTVCRNCQVVDHPTNILLKNVQYLQCRGKMGRQCAGISGPMERYQSACE